MSDVNLQEIHDFLVSIAKEAGKMITFAKPVTNASGEKKNSVDLVTETDQAVEKMITEAALSEYPNFKYVEVLDAIRLGILTDYL